MTANLPVPVPHCEKHGPMTLRPLARQTKEQAWCGIWYDCANAWPHCGNTALFASPELRTQLAKQRARIATTETRRTP